MNAGSLNNATSNNQDIESSDFFEPLLKTVEKAAENEFSTPEAAADYFFE
ncbi:MAG: hypothetical protein N2484_03215 [Clostridia bacterium]|nr:hypothetical protein [Clostridia bacterium]